MIDTIRFLLSRQTWTVLRHIMVTTYRHKTGRLYVFRDRPLWFVTAMTQCAAYNLDESLSTYYAEATAELRLRNLRLDTLLACEPYDAMKVLRVIEP